MSTPEARQTHDEPHPPVDPIEAIVPMIPIVLPIVGGVLIFLLALIAIYVA